MSEGLSQAKTLTSTKLRLNSVLNACTRRGPFLANSAGVVTLIYNCTNGIIGSMRDGKRDAYSSIVSAGISGALFRSTGSL